MMVLVNQEAEAGEEDGAGEYEMANLNEGEDRV
jgi:hypothetical protein